MAAIVGLGTAVANVLPQSEAIKHAALRNCDSPKRKEVLARAYRLAGLESRSTIYGYDDVVTIDEFLKVPSLSAFLHGPGTGARMQLYRETVPPLAVRASRNALVDANIDSRSITHLITITCTGFSAPGFDIELIDRLELQRDVSRTQIGFMGCHAALNGLRVARTIVEADPAAVVLMCAVEACSLHFQYGWDSDRIVANAIFADGAAAAIIQNAPSAHLQLRASGSFIVRDSKDAMTWTIGDNGFVMTLSPAVPKLIHDHLPDWLESWLGSHGLSVSDVASWAVHPGGPRILSAAEQALGLSAEQIQPSKDIFAKLGNMSSPTLLFILESMRSAAVDLPLVMIGFGPGLAIEAALIGGIYS